MELEVPCIGVEQNLKAEITLKDGAGTEIGTSGLVNIDDQNPYSFWSALIHPLRVTGEHQGDYIQFNYGELSWTSAKENKDGDSLRAACSTGGWDPRAGSSCGHEVYPGGVRMGRPAVSIKKLLLTCLF